MRIFWSKSNRLAFLAGEIFRIRKPESDCPAQNSQGIALVPLDGVFRGGGGNARSVDRAAVC